MDNIEKSYKEIVVKIIDDIKNTQKSIFAGANKNLLDLYYRIGEHIDKNANWGNKFIDNLAMDIKINFPKIKGFSIRDLRICINIIKYAVIAKLCRRRLHKYLGAILCIFLIKLTIIIKDYGI